MDVMKANANSCHNGNENPFFRSNKNIPTQKAKWAISGTKTKSVRQLLI